MTNKPKVDSPIRGLVIELLNAMTLSEKIGQLSLVPGGGPSGTSELVDSIKQGRLGGILNEIESARVEELQRVAVEESRLGIPLLFGRDVIHGFKTIFPIPLGLAACWNREVVYQCARTAAVEAAAAGINWTYAPMLDIGRDPRWGRVAETFGEDPYLISELAREMVTGFQGEDLSEPDSIAACAKHFVGYGASESGRDYNTTNIPMNELHNVHLRPFRAAIEAGVASMMTSFSDFDGVPVSANHHLLTEVLRGTLGFDGLVVSDFKSISQLTVHGLTGSDRESAREAALAGVDMEMSSSTYEENLERLLTEGRITMTDIDRMVSNVLTLKARLGLFDRPHASRTHSRPVSPREHLASAYRAAVESVVLLKNHANCLPVDIGRLKALAVIGPMADEPYEQLGTWVFDGDSALSQTPLDTLQTRFGETVKIQYARGVPNTRSKDRSGFAEAVRIARESDLAILFVGEESILSGEAHCRADIRLPGCQQELVAEIAKTGKPVVAIVMAGRPLVLQTLLDRADSVLFAWHPGSMAGPALVDLITGEKVPSGKLPVTFPRMTGQIPIYCAHKNTGRPATDETYVHIDDIKRGAFQTSVGNTSFYFDAGYTPQFPLGFGLSYVDFEFANIRLSSAQLRPGEVLYVEADLTNRGTVEAEEVAQLYVRDLVGSVTRPIKELVGFKRVTLKPGETKTVEFSLTSDDLAFYNRNLKFVSEPGEFHVWIGGSSDTELRAEFELLAE